MWHVQADGSWMHIRMVYDKSFWTYRMISALTCFDHMELALVSMSWDVARPTERPHFGFRDAWVCLEHLQEVLNMASTSRWDWHGRIWDMATKLLQRSDRGWQGVDPSVQSWSDRLCGISQSESRGHSLQGFWVPSGLASSFEESSLLVLIGPSVLHHACLFQYLSVFKIWRSSFSTVYNLGSRTRNGMQTATCCCFRPRMTHSVPLAFATSVVI